MTDHDDHDSRRAPAAARVYESIHVDPDFHLPPRRDAGLLGGFRRLFARAS